MNEVFFGAGLFDGKELIIEVGDHVVALGRAAQ